MLRCKDVVELMGRAGEVPLSRRETWGVRLHLLWCRHCRAYRRGLDQMSRLARGMTPPSSDPDRLESVVASVRRAPEDVTGPSDSRPTSG